MAVRYTPIGFSLFIASVLMAFKGRKAGQLDIHPLVFCIQQQKKGWPQVFAVYGLRKAAHRRDMRRQSVSTGYINSGQITMCVIHNAIQVHMSTI